MASILSHALGFKTMSPAPSCIGHRFYPLRFLDGSVSFEDSIERVFEPSLIAQKEMTGTNGVFSSNGCVECVQFAAFFWGECVVFDSVVMFPHVP